MRKFLTIFFTTLLAYAVGFDVGWAETETLIWNTTAGRNAMTVTKSGASSTGGDIQISQGDITITGTGNHNTSGYLQVYANNTITISCSSGNISTISITAASSYNAERLSGTGYTATGTSGTWSGTAASSVSLTNTASGQCRIQKIEVTYTSGGTPQPTTYSITGTGTTTGGTISATATSNITSGTNVTLTATPETGYELTEFFVGATDVFSNMTGPDANGAYTYDLTVTADVTVSATFTAQSSGGGDKYELVTSLSSSDVGKEFILVYNNTPAVFGGISTTSTKYGLSQTGSNNLSLNNNIITIPSGSAAVPLTLREGNSTGTWSFEFDSKYLTWTSGNSLNTATSITNNSSWSISIASSGDATITNVNTNTRYLRYNTGSPRFACYAPGDNGLTGAEPQLYRKVEAAKAYDITVASGITNGTVQVSPTSSDGNENITVTATPASGYQLASLTFTPDGGTATTVTSGWTESNGEYTYTYTSYTTGDLEVLATFSKIQYSITNVVKTNGETSGAGGGLNNFTGVSTVDGVWGAKVGDEVTFTANTYNGYQMLQSGISIKDADNNDVSFTFGSGNLVTFTMPASNVTVTANFTTYRGTIRLAGRFNGNTGWRTGTSGPAFTYDSTNDKYTIDAYFTGECDGNYFFITYDGNASYPSSDGNWGVTNTIGTPVALTWDGNGHNFAIENGVFTIELAGDLSTIAFTKKNYSITFSPASGNTVEAGQTVTATCALSDDIDDIQASDSGAAGTVTVTCNPSTLNTVGENQTVNASAAIGNIAVTGTASYTVTAVNTSNNFALVTDLSTELIAGKKYIIVNENNNTAYSGKAYGNTLDGASSITITDHATTIDPDDVAVLTLGGSSGAWTFSFTRNGDTYNVYHASATAVKDNSLDASTSETASAFTIGLSSGTFDIAADGKHLRANGANDFRFYDANSSGTAIQLYKQTVEEVKDYGVTVNQPAEGGTITASPSGANCANEGETITLTVTPSSADYTLASWSVVRADNNQTVSVTGNGTTESPYQFLMPASNVTVTATFTYDPAYALTYVATPSTAATITGPATAHHNDRVELTVTITDSDDYTLESIVTSWGTSTGNVNGEGTQESPYFFLMPAAATTVTATFAKKPHTFTVVSDHGTVNGLPASAISGTSVSFTVNPNAGYVITNVVLSYGSTSEELTATNGTYTFTQPGKDVTITVNYFMSDEYELLTDLNDIVEGETYLLVGGAPTHVMSSALVSGQANSVELDAENYDSASGIITSTADMAIVNFLVQGSGDNKTYAIHTINGYLNNTKTGDSSNANNLDYSVDPVYNTIAIDADGKVTIKLVNADIIRNQFSYNSGLWKYYKSSQGATYIYKVASTVKRPVIAGAAGQYLGKGNFIGTDEVTITTATQGAAIYYTTDGSDPTTSSTLYSAAFSLPNTAVGNTVTVKAIAVSGGETSKIAEQVFTCIRPQKPTFGSNWDGENDVTFYNPMFIYPKRNAGDVDVKAYGAENIYFYRTFDGTTPAIIDGNKVTDMKNGDYYIYLDKTVDLSVVKVINGIASDPAEGTLAFAVAAPEFSLAAGNYDGDQTTRLSTETKTTQNNVTWETKMYYTFGNTEFAFNSTTGAVTSEEWIEYDAANNPYVTIEAPGTKTLRAVTITNYFNGKTEWHQSAVSQAVYVLSAANLSVTVTPAPGTYTYTQNVTLEPKNGIGTVNIYYTTDGTTPSSSSTLYNDAITVASDMTIKVYAEDSREGADGKTFTGEYVYKIGVQAPVFSPLPGTYYTGANGDITVEMFSVSPNAKIYYTTDGSTPSKTNGTLYTGDIPLNTGSTYNFKAIAYVGNKESGVSEGTYTIGAKLTGNYWQNIAEMNADDAGVTKMFANPIQVVYMSTFENNGTKPQFAFVRDNSAYGYIYFGNKNVTKYNNYTKYQMGDWLPAQSVEGTTNVWGDSYINELGTSGGAISQWPASALQNAAIMPEETSNMIINEGWNGSAYDGSDYETGVVTDKHLFGHYVHLRKNVIEVKERISDKWCGIITDESGVPLTYYDGMYLYSGHNSSPNYDNTHFQQIQNKGGTFDVYGVVYFYGPYATNSTYNNTPYEIFPIDFEYTFPAVFHMGGTTYEEQTQEVTIHETKTVTLTCDKDGAQIWYKTSEMEDYEVYESPITVDKTMTIETYSSYPSKYNDYLESKVYTLIVNLGEEPAPVISPESSLNAVGDPAINVTIGFESGVEVPEGITIYYTTDDSDPSTSETRMVYVPGETTLSISTTTTVRAIAFLDDFYSPEAEERTYTFVRSNGIIYTLVTSDDDLDENSVYVVVNQAEAMSMQRTQKDNNRDAAPVLFVTESNMPTGHTFAGNLKEVYGNDDLAVFTMRETGTGEWYFHTANGVNNASTGFLYGAVSGSTNQLKTNTADSPTGVQNINWTIEIDADGTAHMFSLYNDQPRYLRFNKSFGLYNTYGSESTGLPVYLYKKEATPLALIEKMGTTEAGHNQYTIADELEIVAANDVLGYIWVKDADASIARTEIKDGQIDYMRDVAASGDADDINVMVDVLKQEGEWDQSNWAIIEVSAARLPAGVSKHSDLVGCRIKPASLTAKYVDDQNYKLTAENSLNDITEALDKRYTPNVYCAANFWKDNLNLTDASTGAASYDNKRHYFFVNPKVQEVVTITYAVWDGTNFVLPAKDGEALNGAGLHGAFAPGWTYNSGGQPTLTVGEAYQFTAVVNKGTGQPVISDDPNPAPRKVAGTGDSPDGTYVVMPMNLSGNGNIVTVVENVKTVAREVVGVEFYNVAGQRSDKPFEGVNIIVTRYDDGTTSTAKVLK